jgi:hypothetical protein
MAPLTAEKAALEEGSEGSDATVLNLSHRALSDVSGLPPHHSSLSGVMFSSVAHGVSGA